MAVWHHAADMAGAKMVDAASWSTCMPSRGEPSEFLIRSSVHGCECRALRLLAPFLQSLPRLCPSPHGHNQVSIANAPCQSGRNDSATIGVDPRLTLCKLQGASQLQIRSQPLSSDVKSLQIHTDVYMYSSR